MNGKRSRKRRRAARERLRRMLEHVKAREEPRNESRSVSSHPVEAADAAGNPTPKLASHGLAANGKRSTEHSAVGRAKAAPEQSPSQEDRDRQRQRQIDALERDVFELSQLTNPSDQSADDIERIRREVEELRREFYTHLGASQRLALARHPQRPQTDDYIRLLFESFSEIHGDRGFADDPALITGMAWFHGNPIMVMGTVKGHDTKQRLIRNFGQAKPEGYRKSLRVMKLAAKFRRPIFVFIDTPGAYPGVDAEERGQAEAIAHNLREMSRLPVPIVVTITGEGGSGGALAVAIGDRILMLENSVYSVISPEGCASILWRDAAKAEIAAEALKITSLDLLRLKLIDELVAEPDGGAHYDHASAARLLDASLKRALEELSQLPTEELVEKRYRKFRSMGEFFA
jgi:acetyl-CoA carboxylase carboxyl transferase subunit alpha